MNKNITIGEKTIGENSPVFIIAEGGVNHNGKLELALKLVEAAHAAGADAIKFQTWKAEELVTMEAEMATYQIKNLGKTERQYDMLKQVELPDEFFVPIKKRCIELGIILLSTPHGGLSSIDRVNALGLDAFKFGSGDLTNLPALKYAARLKKPMILGTGMAELDEVEEAIKTIQNAGNNDIMLLHCTTNYPCPLEEVNLLAMKTMEEKLGCIVGYSDHTESTMVSALATSLGARVIEKHLTLDRNMVGPDHKASMEPDAFQEMVKYIRDTELILGSPEKKPNPSEIPIMKIARKSVVALKPIKKGETFSSDNIGVKRPGNGLHPRRYAEMLGKKATRDIPADSLIQENSYEK